MECTGKHKHQKFEQQTEDSRAFHNFEHEQRESQHKEAVLSTKEGLKGKFDKEKKIRA